MALSLSGERSLAAATPTKFFAIIARWFAKAQAARTRRTALKSLLDLDHARLSDLGVSRDDIAKALHGNDKCPEQVLNAARARNAGL